MMKTIKQISLLVMFSLCAVVTYADRGDVEHDFEALTLSSKLTFENSNHTGITGLLTYTCTNGAVFGKDLIYAEAYKKTCINFGSEGCTVTTTAVDSVARVIVYYYRVSDSKTPTIELRLSRDSVHWTDPIEPTSSSGANYEFNFVPGRYYIRLTNQNKNKASINKIKYSFGWCNCFLYIPE